MKRIIFSLLLLLYSVSIEAQVIPERSISPTGYSILRFHNNTPYTYTCWLRDQVNFHAFTISARQTTGWAIVHGYYEWECARA